MTQRCKLAVWYHFAIPILLSGSLMFFTAWSFTGCSASNEEDSHMYLSKVNAPELSGGLGWLNIDKPLTIKELKGKIVLLDFWTFCCINCMHVIPDLKRLEDKYPNELVVIGVHSAKFDNEKDSKNIKDAILRYGIKHPVVNDANFAIWQSYGVRAWPTLVLIDPEGHIVGQISGEGHFEELDQAINSLVKEFEARKKIDRAPLACMLEKNKSTPLFFPGKIVADPKTEKLFISDSGHNRIIITTPNGKLLDIIGSGHIGHQNGSYAASSFNHPQGLALRGDQLYVADTENHLIRHIDLKSKTVITEAGTGFKSTSLAYGGALSSTPLNSPWDLVWVNDKLYIAMAGCHQIWLLDPKTKTIERFAGSGREDIIDGPLKLAALAQPSGLTSNGTLLFFVDSETSSVRSCELGPNGTVKTIVGQGLFEFGDWDDKGPQAKLQHPLGILWLNDRLLVADSYNHKIKKVDPTTKAVTTLLGTGKSGFVNGNTPQFKEPNGLTALNSLLYIADTNNHQIRTANLKTGEVSTFTIKNLHSP